MIKSRFTYNLGKLDSTKNISYHINIDKDDDVFFLVGILVDMGFQELITKIQEPIGVIRESDDGMDYENNTFIPHKTIEFGLWIYPDKKQYKKTDYHLNTIYKNVYTLNYFKGNIRNNIFKFVMIEKYYSNE